MTVTPTVYTMYGTSPVTEEEIGSQLYFKRSDDNSSGTLNPLHRPATTDIQPIRYSYRKHVKIGFSPNPDTEISNLTLWMRTSTPLPTGLTLYYTTNAVYSHAVTSDEFNLYSSAVTMTTDVPYVINSNTVMTNTTPGSFGDQPYVVFQLGIATNATTGYIGTISNLLEYRWDES